MSRLSEGYASTDQIPWRRVQPRLPASRLCVALTGEAEVRARRGCTPDLDSYCIRLSLLLLALATVREDVMPQLVAECPPRVALRGEFDPLLEADVLGGRAINQDHGHRRDTELLRSLIGEGLPPILRSSTGGHRRLARQDETSQDESQHPEHEEPLQDPVREPSHRQLHPGDSVVDPVAQGWGKIWSIVGSYGLTRLYGSPVASDAPD